MQCCAKYVMIFRTHYVEVMQYIFKLQEIRVNKNFVAENEHKLLFCTYYVETCCHYERDKQGMSTVDLRTL